jgi:hypothetical protein
MNFDGNFRKFKRGLNTYNFSFLDSVAILSVEIFGVVKDDPVEAKSLNACKIIINLLEYPAACNLELNTGKYK